MRTDPKVENIRNSEEDSSENHVTAALQRHGVQLGHQIATAGNLDRCACGS
jgi:hypothetical protein